MSWGVAGLAFLGVAKTCLAEDWTVKGKVYHNVTVVEAGPNIVLVSYEGSAGQPWFAINDLSPELQKRFRYDSKKTAEGAKMQISQDVAVGMVLIELWSDGGPRSYHEEVQKERPAAVTEMEKHPIKLVGTVIYGSDSIYAVEAEASGAVLDGKGGTCYLLSNKSLEEGQKISVSVYPTRSPSINGKTYSCFSDDAGTAYDADHTWGG